MHDVATRVLFQRKGASCSDAQGAREASSATTGGEPMHTHGMHSMVNMDRTCAVARLI